MSLNRTHAPDNTGVILFNGEWMLLYTPTCDLGLELESGSTSTIPAAFKSTYHGDLFLTSHRVIFRSKKGKGGLQSFALPFVGLRGVQLEQPIFGSNYLKGRIIADPDPNWANWSGSAKFKLWFSHGGCIEFGQALLNAVQNASSHGHVAPAAFLFMGEPSVSAGMMPVPPEYVGAGGLMTGAVQVPPPAYTPYSLDENMHYSFVQPAMATFNQSPPPGSVWMVGAPPPYPGVAPYEPSSYAPRPCAPPGVGPGLGPGPGPTPSAPPPYPANATNATAPMNVTANPNATAPVPAPAAGFV